MAQLTGSRDARDRGTKGIAQPSAERLSCPVCEKTFAGSSIVDDEPAFDEDGDGGWFLLRHLFCDHCDHLVVWREACTGVGRPLGYLIDDPPTPAIIFSRKAIDEFLSEHPGAKGVNQ